MRRKFDYSITPLRLTTVIMGLALVGLNEFFQWEFSVITYLAPAVIVLVVYLTQHRNAVTTVQTCDICQKPRVYNEKYDAYFCMYCNKWLEKKCKDAACNYCSNRPDSPTA